MFEQCVSMGDKYVGTANNTRYLDDPHRERENEREQERDSSTHLLLRAVAPWDSIFGIVHGFSYSNNTSDSGSAATNPHPSAWWQRPKRRRRRKHVVSVNGNSQQTFMDYGYK